MPQKLQRRRKSKPRSESPEPDSAAAPKQTRDSIEDVWGERTPYVEDWPSRIDAHVVEAPDRWVQSCCVLCSNGCALDIGVKDGKIVGVRGREVDRVNRGRLGPKGLHGWAANHSADRLTHPLIRDGKKFRKATWKEAMDLIVERQQADQQRRQPPREPPAMTSTPGTSTNATRGRGIQADRVATVFIIPRPPSCISDSEDASTQLLLTPSRGSTGRGY